MAFTATRKILNKYKGVSRESCQKSFRQNRVDYEIHTGNTKPVYYILYSLDSAEATGKRYKGTGSRICDNLAVITSKSYC